MASINRRNSRNSNGPGPGPGNGDGSGARRAPYLREFSARCESWSGSKARRIRPFELVEATEQCISLAEWAISPFHCYEATPLPTHEHMHARVRAYARTHKG